MAIQPDKSAQLFWACSTAHSKCKAVIETITGELKALHKTTLWQYDACGLSKPVYSVAALIARSPKLGTREDFLVCLEVLQKTRWVYSDHEKNVADLRFLWNVSRDESLDEPLESPESLSPPDGFDASLLRQQPLGRSDMPPTYGVPDAPLSPSPPFSPIFRQSSPVQSGSVDSFYTSEGDDSLGDGVPAMPEKNPSGGRQ